MAPPSKRPAVVVKRAENWLKVKGMDGDKLTAVASTSAVDRDGERFAPGAFRAHLADYLANPVVLAAHVHQSPDGRPTIIGSAKRLEYEDDALVFEMQFASTALAQEWRSLYEEGHARAFSVGFIPISGKVIDGVYTHTEAELLEISAVPVGSNREALARGVNPDELRRMVRTEVREAALAAAIDTLVSASEKE